MLHLLGLPYLLIANINHYDDIWGSSRRECKRRLATSGRMFADIRTFRDLWQGKLCVRWEGELGESSA